MNFIHEQDCLRDFSPADTSLNRTYGFPSISRTAAFGEYVNPLTTIQFGYSNIHSLNQVMKKKLSQLWNDQIVEKFAEIDDIQAIKLWRKNSCMYATSYTTDKCSPCSIAWPMKWQMVEYRGKRKLFSQVRIESEALKECRNNFKLTYFYYRLVDKISILRPEQANENYKELKVLRRSCTSFNISHSLKTRAPSIEPKLKHLKTWQLHRVWIIKQNICFLSTSSLST